jgi:hypothetical protein
MPNKPEFKSISIKEEFAESIEEFIRQHPSLGYRSIAQFLEDSSRRRLEELKSQVKAVPRFLKINGDEQGVKIYDNELKGNKQVDVYFTPNGIRCGYHQLSDCEHIRFALSLPEVRNMVRKRQKEGWKLELPEE